MSIRLPPFLTEQCLALLRLGNMLQIFQETDIWNRGIAVTQRLNLNQLFIQDLQDIQLLGDVILDNDEINDYLRSEIIALQTILNMFINTAAMPAMACGRWI